MALILAIESSCDETSVAITKDGKLLSNVINTQIEVHQKYGGVMPEIASRLHCENISLVLKEALEKADVKLEDIDAFAVTRGPGLIGALHVGMQCAKTLATLYKKPLIPVHHLAGHIYANEYNEELKFPLLAVVVSGGNSELVIMKDHMNFEIIGETRDDAIGECYDKVARVLGLPYPGGIPIDKLAKEGEHTYHLPTPLSGLSFIREHFENHADATLGSFAARDVRLFRHPDPKNPARESIGIEASVSLAPFDLGIFQKFRMYSQEFEIKGIDEVVVDLKRIGGTPDSWVRSNRAFASELREQFLLWRSLPIATVEHYRQATRDTLGLS